MSEGEGKEQINKKETQKKLVQDGIMMLCRKTLFWQKHTLRQKEALLAENQYRQKFTFLNHVLSAICRKRKNIFRLISALASDHSYNESPRRHCTRLSTIQTKEPKQAHKS